MDFTRAALLTAVLVTALPVTAAGAETLWDALAMAYSNNPTLLAERARVRATDEGVSQALSGWRPTVTIEGSGGVGRSDSNVSSSETVAPRTGSLNVVQPLYRGGRTVEGTRGAENAVLAARERLRATEQEVLLDAVTAYMDVLRDQAVVELNRNNERVLRRQLEATQDRFEVGELTRTDVAQSEARLSRAVSNRVRAEGDLAASWAFYKQVVGKAPESLELAPPLSDVVTSEAEAQAIADAEEPNLLASQFDEQAARHAVRSAAGNLLPTLSLSGELRHSDETVGASSSSDRAEVLAVVSVPLYQSGLVWSEVREARQTLSQRRREVDESRRTTVEAVTRAWQALQTARAQIQSDSDQVRANEIALEGVREEATVGARTTLDVLDAEQELLDARVSLVRAQRDEYVAAFELRQAMGRLTARHLGLQVELYEPSNHYGSVRGKWFGLGEAEQ